ncbi:hypothetical protein ACHQM5_018702 [Ranunculus cassubicifolius]
MQLENFSPLQSAAPFEFDLQHSERFSPYSAFSPSNNTSQKRLKTSATEHSSCSTAVEKSRVNKEVKEANTKCSMPNSNLSCTQEHAIAERKRREKLSQQFIALSGMVPGLKKIDKSSILESLIKYIKQLEEKVKILEEKTSKKTMHSTVLVSKVQLPSDKDSSTSSGFVLPQIETRVLERNLLIRIHCENHKGVLGKIFSEVQKLNLSVVNYSVMSFDSSTVDVSISTEMEEEFNITVKDLLKRLHSSLVCCP